MFTIEIEKSKIIEIWNSDHNKVLKYTQLLKEKESNVSKKIIAEDLTGLMVKVREQVQEWENSGDII